MKTIEGFIISDVGFVPERASGPDKYTFPDQEEAEICRQWIEKFCKPRRQVNLDAYSYVLKHKVEKWAGRYVSNGAFILAAVDMGYGAQVEDYGPNTYFKMQLLLPETAWKRVHTSGFSRWLFRQKELNNSIGDLARDAVEDETWPRKAKRFIDFRLYLEGMQASEACLRTLKEAWVVCYGQAPPYPDFRTELKCEQFYEGECDTLFYGESYQKAPIGKEFIYVLFESEEEDWRPRVRYVGRTKDPARRLREHIVCPGSVTKVKWTAKLLERGVYPRMGVIELVDKDDAAFAEEVYIVAFGDNERHPNQAITEVMLNSSLIRSC